MPQHRFDAILWEWGGKGSWHFVTLPADLSGLIRMGIPRKAGFGSVRVSAEIGGHRWKTSLFPDAKSGCYLLPVSAAVRARCHLAKGDGLEVALTVVDMP